MVSPKPIPRCAMPPILDIRPQQVESFTLAQLATQLHAQLLGDQSLIVTGISLDSKQLREGDIFAALPGRNRHGAEFASQAIASGAVAVLSDEAGAQIIDNQGLSLPVLVVPE